MPSNNQNQGGGKSNWMTKEDASRIQSTQATSGKNTGSGSFASRAQAAGDKNSNANSSGGAQGGGQKK
ncbi:uncharacterized protein BDR25DRAFT_303288 [Lindgomyces ingoldianus]|uniref:Uncharacterized protein n=1 Tax=Lindgomyces ingoldianus TaxID=673940 RepID=A0ACB6QWH6_9PLEO|nr:uncharacterized protein BDR25DRAFT_303288 [Lindgomyces ingoldianus]KAF2471167.1 hypothetical protein BDR25DRAFT_303288 [Lindgomyces ingoldianus]